jgi:hypothetical protein
MHVTTVVYLSSKGDVDPTINPKINFFNFKFGLALVHTVYIC